MNDRTYRIYDVTITTLNPLHIGTGRTLLNGYDFAVRNDRTYRLNEDAILGSFLSNFLNILRRAKGHNA